MREYPLTKERTTIGRKPHNDIVIDNLAVSGEHAMIMTILNDSFLEDLGSTNGTLVNGQPIKKHFLQNNDVVELGKYKLKYVTEATCSPGGSGGLREDHGAARAARQAACPSPSRRQAARGSRSRSPKNFGDTVVNPELMQSQSTGGSLREAARQACGWPPARRPRRCRACGTGSSCTRGRAGSHRAGCAATPAPARSCRPVAASGGAAAARRPPARRAAPGGIQGTIQILSGPSAGKELPLSKPLTTLGKPGVQVAVIAKRPQGYFITHVEGGSFPVVNGKQLDAQAHRAQRPRRDRAGRRQDGVLPQGPGLTFKRRPEAQSVSADRERRACVMVCWARTCLRMERVRQGGG